jgi:His/Glu/Gln/Arg/opine family amino acid ABC transporter permease subunit
MAVGAESFVALANRILPSLLSGALITVAITVISMTFGIVIGFIVALGRLSNSRLMKLPLAAYVEIIRGVPLVVQLLFIYFTLPQFGISLTPFWAGVVGLAVHLGAYLSEVFRSAIMAISRGQMEAGLSIGMQPMTVYRRIIIPQAARLALPTLSGYLISTLKDSSLVSFISVNDLLRQGMIEISSSFRTMEIYALVSSIYFAMSFVASRLVALLDRQITPRYLRQRRRSRK